MTTWVQPADHDRLIRMANALETSVSGLLASFIRDALKRSDAQSGVAIH